MNEDRQPSDSESASRDERIRDIVDDFLRTLAEQETNQLFCDTLIKTHPELMPELEEELRKVQMVFQAEEQSPKKEDFGLSGHAQTTDFSQSPSTTFRGLQIRCPHCQSSIELDQIPSFTDITCQSCGSTFSLINQTTETHLTTPLKSIGHFELVSRLGIGSFGTVWKAHDTELERTVAIKIPRKGQLDAVEEEQFLREARAVAQLNHPHIVGIHEVGRDGDSLYIVSDLVRGVSLSTWLSARVPEYRESALLCAQIALALDHAHQAGVIHRDLKPSNIMVDGDGEPHIMDFGLAKREADEITMTVEGQILGTPAYMPPEQARGEGHHSDRRSDVYSLGVILFEMLTGELPFRGNPRMLVHQIINDKVPALRGLDNRIPLDLETICSKCLEKDPRHRYQSASAVADELQRFLSGRPILARPLGSIGRVHRWCARNPMATALVILLCVVAVSAPLVAWRESHLKQMARTEAARAKAATATAQKAEDDAMAQRNRAFEKEEAALRLLYVADMNVAQGALNRANAARTTQILHDHEQDKLRGFEWDFLWRATHQYLTQQVGHAGRIITAVAASPDGHIVATGGQDGYVRLWSVSPQRRIAETKIDRGYVLSLAFSHSGSRLAMGGQHGQIQLWDWKDRTVETVKPHRSSVVAIAFAPNDERLVSASYDGTACVLNLTDNRAQHILQHDGYVSDVAFVNGATQVITGCRKSPIWIWDAQTGKVAESVGQAEESPLGKGKVTCLSVAHDGAAIYAGDTLGRIWKRHATTGKTESAFSHEHTAEVTSLQMSPDGSLIISSSLDGTIKIWNPLRQESICTLKGHSSGARDVTFVGDSNLIGSVGNDGSLKFWSLDQVTRWTAIKPHRLLLKSVAFAPDGNSFYSIGKESGKTIKRNELWEVKQFDVQTGELIQNVTKSDSPLECGAISPDGQTVAIGTVSKDLEIQLFRSGSRLPRTLQGHTSIIMSVAFLDDNRLLSTSFDDTVRFWNIESGTPSRVLEPATQRPLMFNCVAVDARKKIVAAGDMQGGIHLWRTSGDPIDVVNSPEVRASVKRLVFSPVEGLLAAANGTATVIWDLVQREPLATLQDHSQPVTALAFTHDGQRLATGGEDGVLTIWERTTWQPILTFSFDGDLGIASLAFAPQDDALLVGLANGRIHAIWADISDDESATSARQ